jgi:hypothetical protein
MKEFPRNLQTISGKNSQMPSNTQANFPNGITSMLAVDAEAT